MQANRRDGRVPFARAQGLEDAAVLPHGYPRTSRIPRPQRDANQVDLTSKQFEHASEHGVAGCLGNPVVKRVVFKHHRPVIAAERRALRALERCLQLLEQLGRRALRGEARGQGLQRLAHGVHVGGFFERDGPHHHPAIGRAADQPLGRETAKRLPDGRAADRKLPCEFQFEEAMPRRQFTKHNGPPEPPVNGVGNGPKLAKLYSQERQVLQWSGAQEFCIHVYNTGREDSSRLQRAMRGNEEGKP